MEEEIVPADKRHRRLALVTAVLITLVGVLLLGILYGYLGQIKRDMAEKDRRTAEGELLRLTAAVNWIGGLSFVGMGAWFWRLGRRINRSGRFPPPGAKVIRDTRVRTGAKARELASLAQAAALLCVLAGTAGMWYLYRLVVAVLRQ